MVIDGFWSERRREYRKKEGIENRVLNDGRMFRGYKKHFTRSEFEGMLEGRSFTITEIYEGGMFIAAIAERANQAIENS